MSIIGKDLSVESVLNSIFSKEEEETSSDTPPTTDTPPVEEEEKEDTVEIPEIVKAELADELSELSEDENEVIDSPIEEEEGADEEAMAEESARLHGEIGKMQLALQTAEEFIFSKYSTEADLGKVSAALKKFWDWIVAIVEKIRMFILTVVKRIQIWAAGDMKNITKWANENKTKIAEGLTKSGETITLKTRLPLVNIAKVEALKAKNELPSSELRDKAIAALKAKKFDEAVYTELDKANRAVTINKIVTEVYGDASASDVTAVSFNKVVNIVDTLTKADAIKGIAKELIEKGKATTSAISTFKSLSKADLPAEEVANLKKLAVAIQKSINLQVSVSYWLVSTAISQVKVAKSFAAKLVIAAGKKEEEKK